MKKTSHEDIQKISCLMIYLHKNIEKEIKEKKETESSDKTGKTNGIKLVGLGEKLKNIFYKQLEE